MSCDVIKHPALSYHGSKYRLAPWVVDHFPTHRIYVEPFGGAAGVLLRKPPSYAEVYNDIDGDIVNFFKVLRDPESNQRLRELCALTPFGRDEFVLAQEQADDDIERARRTAVRAMMGFGSAGATQKSNGFRIDTKRQYATATHLWAEYPDRLAAIGRRFTGVLIENRPAISVLKQHDTPNTLHYADPPYMPIRRICQKPETGEAIAATAMKC